MVTQKELADESFEYHMVTQKKTKRATNMEFFYSYVVCVYVYIYLMPQAVWIGEVGVGGNKGMFG